jgi:tRNA(Ile)-lysidine synthase
VREAARVSRALLDRCTFPPAGTAVTCAVSGGADSVALLVLAIEAGCDATAVHVDHGLRPDSARDADVVWAVAERVGAGFRSVRVDVGEGPNLEARARAARYRELPDDVLTGHTADDQAETVVLNALRGTGLDGVSAMRPGCRRPILALRRHETRELCRQLGLATVDDPSNEDLRFRRNRVRHEVMPLLDEIAERDVVPLLVRLAEHARDATDHLELAAAAIDPTDGAALAAADPELARRAVRRWLRTTNPERHPPSRATVDRVLAVARVEERAAEVGGGWRVARTGGRLRLQPPT